MAADRKVSVFAIAFFSAVALVSFLSDAARFSATVDVGAVLCANSIGAIIGCIAVYAGTGKGLRFVQVVVTVEFALYVVTGLAVEFAIPDATVTLVCSAGNGASMVSLIVVCYSYLACNKTFTYSIFTVCAGVLSGIALLVAFLLASQSQLVFWVPMLCGLVAIALFLAQRNVMGSMFVDQGYEHGTNISHVSVMYRLFTGGFSLGALITLSMFESNGEIRCIGLLLGCLGACMVGLLMKNRDTSVSVEIGAFVTVEVSLAAGLAIPLFAQAAYVIAIAAIVVYLVTMLYAVAVRVLAYKLNGAKHCASLIGKCCASVCAGIVVSILCQNAGEGAELVLPWVIVVGVVLCNHALELFARHDWHVLVGWKSQSAQAGEEDGSPHEGRGEEDPMKSYRDVCAYLEENMNLTSRERDVFELLSNGRNAERIAKSLEISLSTARTYIARVFTKLGVSNQQDLIALLEASSCSPNLDDDNAEAGWLLESDASAQR